VCGKHRRHWEKHGQALFLSCLAVVHVSGVIALMGSGVEADFHGLVVLLMLWLVAVACVGLLGVTWLNWMRIRATDIRAEEIHLTGVSEQFARAYQPQPPQPRFPDLQRAVTDRWADRKARPRPAGEVERRGEDFA
jgi:hypothetical protein